MKRKDKKLQQWDFDNYLEFKFDEFLRDAPIGPFEFNPIEVENRNPDQVVSGLWKKLIFNHLRKFTYN